METYIELPTLSSCHCEADIYYINKYATYEKQVIKIEKKTYESIQLNE